MLLKLKLNLMIVSSVLSDLIKIDKGCFTKLWFIGFSNVYIYILRNCKSSQQMSKAQENERHISDPPL